MITLRTKDPARNGNAILYGSEPSGFTGEQLMLVETDFGNRMKLTSRELNELFTVGQVVDYRIWQNERQQLRMEILHERTEG